MKKTLFIITIMAALLLVATVVMAADPNNVYDTPTGTKILSLKWDNSLNYTDASDAVKTTVYDSNATIETTVTSEYGFADLPQRPDHKIQPTQTTVETYSISSEGNASDKYFTTYSVDFSDSPLASGWLIHITLNGELITLDADGEEYATAEPYTEDQVKETSITVVPSQVQANSPNGSYAVCTIHVTSEGRPAGHYTGANGNPYGGTFESTDVTYTTIETSVMTMSRTATVDAPTAYTGGKHDAVPGAVITYIILYNNTGSTSAEDVCIVDKVPGYDQGSTEAAHMGMHQGDQAGLLNVTLSNEAPTGNGWEAAWTTEASSALSKLYSAEGWVVTSEPATIPKTARWVRWKNASIPALETLKLVWGVTIK